MATVWLKDGTAWPLPERLQDASSAQCDAYVASKVNAATVAARLRKYARTPAQMADLRDGWIAVTAGLPAAQRLAVRQWLQDVTDLLARLSLEEGAD